MARRRLRGRRKGRAGDPAADETLDETVWEDWWRLRDEMGKRLGGRASTGMSDPEVLEAARLAQGRARKRP